jgi:hypothetical protein
LRGRAHAWPIQSFSLGVSVATSPAITRMFDGPVGRRRRARLEVTSPLASIHSSLAADRL